MNDGNVMLHGEEPDFPIYPEVKDCETWNLDVQFAEFILPRLQRFKELNKGYPSDLESPEKWDEILDEMIFGFKVYSHFNIADLDEDDPDFDMKANDIMARADRGLKLFGTYFKHLWW